MKSQIRLQQLDERLRQLRLANPSADLTEFLRAELQISGEVDEKPYVYSLLAKELQAHGRTEEAEAAIQASIEIQPQIPDPWISLALHHLYYTQHLEKALSAINTAVRNSHLDENFVRQSHTERIRIALALQRYSIVEESLRVLTEYEPSPHSIDISLEGEFISRIPPDKVNSELIDKYKKKLSG